MTEPRRCFDECPACEGAAGRDVYTGVDYRDGSYTGYWEPCGYCNGTGEIEADAVLITLDDLEPREVSEADNESAEHSLQRADMTDAGRGRLLP